jgi:hypothetical protein
MQFALDCDNPLVLEGLEILISVEDFLSNAVASLSEGGVEADGY